MEVPVEYSTKKRKDISSNHALPVTAMAGILPHPSKAPKSTALAIIDHDHSIKPSYLSDKPVSRELPLDEYEWCKPLALTSRDRLNQLSSTVFSNLAARNNWLNRSPSTENNSQYGFVVSTSVANLQLMEKGINSNLATSA